MIDGLAERLKKYRKTLGLSRETVARNINISSSTLADYENGHRQPSLEVLFRLSGYYHCSTDYFLGKSDENTPMNLDISDLDEQELQVIKDMINILRRNHRKK